MAYTQYNQLAYSFKKLAGKAHTSANRELSNETQGSLIQLSSTNTLFGQSLVTNALVTSNLYATFSNAQSEVVAEKVRFEVIPSGLIIYTPTSGSGTYGIDKRGDGSPTNNFAASANGEHLYFLRISGSYQTNSNNPKKGTGPFVDGYYLTGSNGALQIIPEAFGVGYTPIVSSSTGNISVIIEGAQSVGQLPTTQVAVTMALNTDYPWTQINQNSYRVNSIELGNTSDTDVWMCSATTWQFTQTEDDR